MALSGRQPSGIGGTAHEAAGGHGRHTAVGALQGFAGSFLSLPAVSALMVAAYLALGEFTAADFAFLRSLFKPNK